MIVTEPGSDTPPRYLCWYDGCTNCKAEVLEAGDAKEAAARYREMHPEHQGKLYVYVREYPAGPLYASV
jgi:hypothetical protein